MDSISKEIADLNENYLYNDMLARALVQLLPQEERPHIYFWLEKLRTINGDKKTLMTRNDYMRLLLLAMQSDKLTEPFDQLPSSNDLPPISDIMPPHLFQEMLTSSEQNLSWIDNMMPKTKVAADNDTNFNRMPPYKFLKRQPEPINGITCYFSVFSNQS